MSSWEGIVAVRGWASVSGGGRRNVGDGVRGERRRGSASFGGVDELLLKVLESRHEVVCPVQLPSERKVSPRITRRPSPACPLPKSTLHS
mgnify:CR=1 FL=1